MTAALMRGLRLFIFCVVPQPCIKKRRECIKGEKSSDGKSINLVDLPFFPLETVLIQLAILRLHENIFCRSCHNYIGKFLMDIIRKLGAAVAADLLIKINDPQQNTCAAPKQALGRMPGLVHLEATKILLDI